jgi:NADPH-dependent ferric siderophore reductase
MLITTTEGQETSSFDTLAVLVRQAMAGDNQSLPAIVSLLDQVPTIWEEAFSITKRVERAWIQTIAGQDLITREALKRQVAALKSTLEAESISPLELLVIETICTTWLAWKQAELSAAERLRSYGIALTQAQEHHITACQKRYLGAIRELARIRQLLAPRSTTVLNIANQQQVNVA